MRIDESNQQPLPPHLESLGTTGAVPFPPTAESLKDYGPLADTPDRTSQAQLDLRADIETVTEGQSLSPLQASLRRLGRDRRAMVALAIVLLLVVLSYVGPIFYLHLGGQIPAGITGDVVGPDQYHAFTRQDLYNHDQPFSLVHPLGTDGLGRDVLARVMAGINVSIEVALLVEVIDIGLGVLVGTLAGYFGSWVDTLLARFTDIMFAFPGLLFVVIVAASLGALVTAKVGLIGKVLVIALALGITIWPQMARFVRGQTLQLKEQQFVEASRTVGGTNRKIIMAHIVPNLFSIVIAAATLNVVGSIIGEAFISLIGLGIQAPGSSLGRMINDAIPVATTTPSEILVPVVVLIILVVCLAFIGDGVRDAFDPRTKD